MQSIIIDTPIGKIKITEKSGTIIQIIEYEGNNEIDYSQFSSDNSELINVANQIKEYFNNSRTSFSFASLQKGTHFQMKVWKACSNIPYGETRTYSEIARIIGNPKASRAVGTALSSNKLLLVVPCHRVVSRSGLGGFRLGTSAKKFLLDLES